MPIKPRPTVTPTHDIEQILLLVDSPPQARYEGLRPVVLFGQSAAERARQLGVPKRTFYRRVERFDLLGMRSLFDPDPLPMPRPTLAPHLRQLLVDLKAEYPPFSLRELATICYVASGRKPSHHTVQRVLAHGPAPSRRHRRYLPYGQIPDPEEARLAIIRLHAEGWRVGSIAGHLQIHRTTVYRILRRWVHEGVAGLADKPHTRNRRALKTDLATLNTVRALQQNPELGAFRIQAALRQLGIRLSERTCGRILALNRALYALDRPRQGSREERERKEMPFKAERRHQYWSVDIRYIDAPLVGGKVYVISILENFSRAILSSAISPRQDLRAYLTVLRAAVRQHGAPETLVSDSGGVFLAKEARRIYDALGVDKQEIALRQAWQNYIETQFYVIWNSDLGYTWWEITPVRAGGDHGALRGRRRDPVVSLPARRRLDAGVFLAAL
jgi:transposase